MLQVVVVSSGVLGVCTAAAELDVLASVKRLLCRGIPVVIVGTWVLLPLRMVDKLEL